MYVRKRVGWQAISIEVLHQPGLHGGVLWVFVAQSFHKFSVNLEGPTQKTTSATNHHKFAYQYESTSNMWWSSLKFFGRTVLLQDSNSNQYLTVGVLCATTIFGFKSSTSFHLSIFKTIQTMTYLKSKLNTLYTLNFPPPFFVSPVFNNNFFNKKHNDNSPTNPSSVGFSSS